LRSRLSAVQNKTVADKHFFDRYVAPTPIAAATLMSAAPSGALPLRTSIIGSASEVRFTRSDFGMLLPVVSLAIASYAGHRIFGRGRGRV
jgi:hypothetical protein